MAVFNLRRREVNAKIVYYGPGLSGKTTNLQHIYERLKPDHKGELMTLATQQDRTLFFDFLPVELGNVKGLKTRFQLYTVPGQVFYNSTRKLVLKNCDGVVFVADSRAEALNDNLESLSNLAENLRTHGMDLRELPLILQYNKQDLPSAMEVGELDHHLNSRGAPSFPAEAHEGTGVLETLRAVCKAVIRNLREKEPAQFRSDEDTATGSGELGSPPAAGAEPPAEPATAPAAPSASGAAPVGDPTGSGDTAGGWSLALPERTPKLLHGELHIPIRLERGGEELKLMVRVRVEDEDGE